MINDVTLTIFLIGRSADDATPKLQGRREGRTNRALRRDWFKRRALIGGWEENRERDWLRGALWGGGRAWLMAAIGVHLGATCACAAVYKVQPAAPAGWRYGLGVRGCAAGRLTVMLLSAGRPRRCGR